MNPIITIGNRQTGKTTQLVKAFKKDNDGILVVFSLQMKCTLIEHFKLEKKKDLIITHDDFISRQKLKGIYREKEIVNSPSTKIKKKKEYYNIYIDDAEQIFRTMLGNHTLKNLVIGLEQPIKL